MRREHGEESDAAVVEFMRQVARVPDRVRLPDPSHIWCRAALMYRAPGRSRVLRLVTLSEAVEVAACLAGAVALFYHSRTTVWNLLLG